jgi:phage terminase large subunit-like protein
VKARASQIPDRLARTEADMSLAERLSLRGAEFHNEFVASLSDAEVYDLLYDWRFWARPKQIAPEGDWGTWMIRAGRGFGKTRLGVGFIQERAMEQPRWIALVAKTPADARDFMVEGPGGFRDKKGLNVRPSDRPLFEPSKRRLTWPNGSWATIFSDEDPEQLRGFSGDTAWLDEFGKYRNAADVWENLDFGMREASSDQPRRIITTTPRPIEAIKRIEALKTTVVTLGSSYENRANLDPKWFEETLAAYEGTRFGEQEIHGVLLNPEEVGIVRRSDFKLWPAREELPNFHYIIVSFDTAFTDKTMDPKTRDPDPTACTVWGLFDVPNVQRGGYPNAPQKLGVMLLDCWQDFLGFPDLLERARKEMKIAYGKADAPLIRPLIGPAIGADQGRRPDLLLVEDIGAGRSLRQTMLREGLHAQAYNPGKLSKLQRLHLVSHVFRHGYVWLVESENKPGHPRTWTEPMLEQLCAYMGEGSLDHDDFVDSTTQAIRVMLDAQLLQITPTQDDLDPHALPPSTRSPYGAPLLGSNPYAQ